MPFTGTSSNLTFDLLKEETDKRMSGFIPGETSMSNTVNIPAPDLSYAEMVASSDPRVQQQVQNIRESSRNKLEDQYTSFFKNPGQIMSDVDAAGNSYKKYIDNSLGYSSQRNNEDFYYKNTWENKSFTNKVVTGTGTFLGRVIPQAIMKLGSGLGYVGAMTGELFDEIGDYKNNNYWADVADNVVSTEIDKFEQYFKDYTLPVYHSEKYGSKGFFSKLGMADFWMDEGADASAFFLSALIPGAGMSKLGQLGKVGRLGKFGKVLSAEIPGVVGTLTGSGNVAELGAFVYNTSMEAAVEASHLYKENYEKYLKNHSEAEAKKMASTDAATAFQLNVGILAFSNAFENRLFHKIAGVNTSTRKPIVKVKETGNTLPTPALPEYKNKVSKFFGENSWGDKLKFVGEAILKEGFWEENLQTAIPRVVNGGTYEATERGTGKVNKLKASDNIFSQGLKQIKDAYLGKDVEAETSIGLGALIGVVGSSSASLISGQYSKEKQLKNKILKELTDAREELFNVEAIYEKDDVGNIKRDDKGNPIINPILLNAQQSKIKEMVSKVNSAHELSNNGQKEEANFLFKEVFSKYVLAHLKNGSYEAVINTLNNWGNKTDSELEIFGLEKELSNNPSEFIDLANQVKNIYVQSRNELKYDIPKGMKISEFVTKQENIANKLFDLKLTKYLTKDMQETIFAEILNNPQYKIIADISAIEAELKRVNEDTTTEDKTLVEANREILENQKKILKESNEFLSLDNETKKEYGKKVKKNNALHSLYFQLDNIEKSLKDKKTGIDYFDKEVDTQFDLLVDNLDKTQKEEKRVDDNFYYKKRIENENGEDITYYDLYDNTKANIGSFNTEAEAIKEAKAQSQKIAEDIQKKTSLTSDELVKKREAKQEEDLSAMGTITDLDPKKETEETDEEEFTEVALLELLLENERAIPEEFKEAFISAITVLNDLKANNRIDEFNLNREGLERLLNYFENNKDVDPIYLDYIKEINFLLGREIPEDIETTTTVVAKDIPDTRVTLAIESPQKTVSRELEGKKMIDTTKLLSINGKDVNLKVLKNNPYDSFVNALLLSPEIIDKLHRKEIQLALINDTEELVRIEGRFEEDKIPQILKNLGVVLIFVNKDGSEYIDKATGNKVVMNVDQNVFMDIQKNGTFGTQFEKRVRDKARKYERDEEEVRVEFKQLHQDLLNAVKQVKETGIAYPLDYVTISDGIIEYYTDKEFKAKNVPTITDYSKSLGEDIELEIKDDGGLVAMIDGEFLPISRFNIKDSVLNNGETVLKIVSDLFNSEIQKENEQDIPEIKRSIRNLLYIDNKENNIIVSILDNGNFELMLVDINDNEVDIKEYLKTKRLNVSRALLSGKELLNFYIKNKDGLFEEQSYDTEEYIEMVKNNTYSSQKPYLKSLESEEFIFKTIQPYITFSVPEIVIKTTEVPTTSTEQQNTSNVGVEEGSAFENKVKTLEDVKNTPLETFTQQEFAYWLQNNLDTLASIKRPSDAPSGFSPLISNSNSRAIYDILTARPENRIKTLLSTNEKVDNKKETAYYEKFKNKIYNLFTNSDSNGGWFQLNFGDQKNTEKDGLRRKGYITINKNNLDSFTNKLSDILSGLNIELEQKGYNGSFKVSTSLERLSDSFDNIVIHGANEQEVDKALQIINEYLTKSNIENIIAQKGKDGNLKDGSKSSHTQILAESVRNKEVKNPKYQSLKETTKAETTTTINNNDIEAKKADIERRRLEELRKFGTSERETTKYSIKVLIDPEARVRGEKQSFVSRDLMELAFKNDLSNAGIQTLDTIIRRGGYSSKELAKLLKPEIDRINAKYDAELKALEQQSTSKNDSTEQQPIIPTQDLDPLLKESAKLLIEKGIASPSIVQRKYSIGYRRADLIMSQLESLGIIGAKEEYPYGEEGLVGVKRELLITSLNTIDKIFQNLKNNTSEINKSLTELKALEQQSTVSNKSKISDEEYNNFIDNGIVTKNRINSIAEKVKNNENLSQKEVAIFNDKTSEINNRLAELKALEQSQIGSGVGGDVDVVPVFHHTEVDTEDFDFGNFQRGKKQVNQFGDGLAVSTDTTPFLQNKYGKAIKGEVKNSDFVEINTNKTEKEIYEELKAKGYKFNTPDTGSYIGNDPAKEYDGTEKANEQPAIISLFNDFQKSNPEVKGVKVVNHIIGNQKVSPFYVIYDNKSFYGEGSLKGKAVEQQPTTISVIKAPQVVTNETSLADLLKMDMTIELEIKDTTPIIKIDPTINQEIKEDPNC